MRLKIFFFLASVSLGSWGSVNGHTKLASPLKITIPIDSARFPGTEWNRLTGQFKNDILFGVHPTSPLNRDAWIQRGYLKPLYFYRKPAPGSTTPDKIIESTNATAKIRRQRKPLLAGLSLTERRFPKAVKGQVSVPSNNVQSLETLPQGKGKSDSGVKQKSRKSLPLIVPPSIFSHGNGNHGPLACFLMPLIQPKGHHPNAYFLITAPSYRNYNSQQMQIPSLFSTGFYTSIQNRLPFPPRQVIYVQRPVVPPWDLIAMEDTMKYETETAPPVRKLEDYKGKITKIPALDAEIIEPPTGIYSEPSVYNEFRANPVETVTDAKLEKGDEKKQEVVNVTETGDLENSTFEEQVETTFSTVII